MAYKTQWGLLIVTRTQSSCQGSVESRGFPLWFPPGVSFFSHRGS